MIFLFIANFTKSIIHNSYLPLTQSPNPIWLLKLSSATLLSNVPGLMVISWYSAYLNSQLNSSQLTISASLKCAFPWLPRHILSFSFSSYSFSAFAAILPSFQSSTIQVSQGLFSVAFLYILTLNCLISISNFIFHYMQMTLKQISLALTNSKDSKKLH